MDGETRKSYLRQTPIFSTLSDEELDDIVPSVVKRRLKSNTVIFHENDPAAAFYLVKSGRVKIYKVGPDGREQVLAILSEGQIFGDVPAFDGGPYPATAATMVDSEIYLLRSEDFQDLVRRYPEVALKIIRVLGQRLRQSMELVRDLSFKQVPHRLAGLLLKMSEEYGSETGEGILIDLPLSRQELADIVGTSRETITRELKKMEREGMLKVDRRLITIADRERLQTWAR
ncbi:MAG: Crp/Fnr family transcriptional regulator [Thermoleophilia bacterium]|nr:Crp/Fnr family transcriptional regulator [Thermoleophilia bacterium]